MTRRMFSRLLPLVVAFISTQVAWADGPPRIVRYEGYLQNNVGEPVHCPDEEACGAPLRVTLRIYAEPEGGEPLWSEELPFVPVVEGVLALDVGSQSPLPVREFGRAVYLGVEINESGEMMPRQRITASMFAVRSSESDKAMDAEKLRGIAAEDFPTVDDVLDICLTPASLSERLVADGVITQAQLDGQLASVAKSGRYEDLLDKPTLFSGRFDDLANVPPGLLNRPESGISMSCTEGAILRWQGDGWVCSLDIDTDTKLTESEVDAFVDNNGYVQDDALAAVAKSGSYDDLANKPVLFSGRYGELTEKPNLFSGSFGDLNNIPPGLNDGDDDTLGKMTCAEGQVARWNDVRNAWICSEDVDTRLSESEVDSFVANNGYASDAALAPVAKSGRYDDLTNQPNLFSGSFQDLSNVPAGLSDGDNDVLGNLACGEGQPPKWSDAQGRWVCGVDIDSDTRLSESEVDAFVANNGYVNDATLAPVAKSGSYSDLTNKPTMFSGEYDDLTNKPNLFSGSFQDLSNVPSGLSDGDNDSLASLSCTAGQVPKWNAAVSKWECGEDVDTNTDSQLTESEVDVFVANNGYASDAALAPVAKSGNYSDLSGKPALFSGDYQDLANKPSMFSGAFGDLSGIPAGLMDGDDDTLIALTCADGDVPRWDSSLVAWVCSIDVDTDTDTKLTESEVDAFVANNGYANDAALAAVAKSGSFSDLSGVPTDLLDGDNDMLSSLTCADNEVPKWDGGGSTWVCASANNGQVVVQTFNSTGTWTKPDGASVVEVICIGGGGGGGSGSKSGRNVGGGGGGGGGAVSRASFAASLLPTQETVTVGMGGAGGIAVAAAGDGVPGANGGASSFGERIKAGGGGGGGGGARGDGNVYSYGGGGGGSFGSANRATGGLPSISGANAIAGQGPAGEAAYQAAKSAEWGGGAGGSGSYPGRLGGPGGSSIFGGGAGGGGGGATQWGQQYDGSVGGRSGSYSFGGGGTAGSNGSDNTDTGRGYGGDGGGGGAGSFAGTATNGGSGGFPGGGGGGGGAAQSATAGANISGAGGSGGNGVVIIITYK